MKKLWSIFMIALIISGCAPKKEENDGIEYNGEFFPITYIARGTRDIGSSTAFTNVTGNFRLRFVQSGDEGTFNLSYQFYSEPQYCVFGQNCQCSGGLAGDFDVVSVTTDVGDDSLPYDPLQPYVPPQSSDPTDVSEEIDPITGKPKVAKIYSYQFSILINTLNLDSGCRPESNRSIQIYRFYDGSLIMQDSFREVYLVPETG